MGLKIVGVVVLAAVAAGGVGIVLLKRPVLETASVQEDPAQVTIAAAEQLPMPATLPQPPVLLTPPPPAQIMAPAEGQQLPPQSGNVVPQPGMAGSTASVPVNNSDFSDLPALSPQMKVLRLKMGLELSAEQERILADYLALQDMANYELGKLAMQQQPQAPGMATMPTPPVRLDAQVESLEESLAQFRMAQNMRKKFITSLSKNQLQKISKYLEAGTI